MSYDAGANAAEKVLTKLSRWYLREDIEEIAMNRAGEVWVKPRRQGWKAEPAPELTYDYIKQVCRVLSNINQARFNEQMLPVVSCEIPGRPFRFQAIMGQAVRYNLEDRRGIALAVRILTADDSIKLDSYLDKNATLAGLRRFVEDFDMDADHFTKIADVVAKHTSIIVSGATSTGKAQPLSARLLTPTGWTRMGDAKPGMTLTAPDGRTTRIVGVYPQGVKPVYALRFADGRTVECCGEHLWKIRVGGAWRVERLAAIRDRLAGGGTAGGVPLVAPLAIELPAAEHPVSAYALGVLLGEGALPRHGVRRVGGVNATRAASLAAIQGPSQETGGVATADGAGMPPQALGLGDSDKAFLPEAYKGGTVAQRLELLRGLLDVDGRVLANRDVVLETRSRWLAQDVQEVAWSLGAVAWLTHLRGGAHRLTIRHPDPAALFTVPAKSEAAAGEKRRLTLAVSAIDFVRDEECRCIAVDHPDQLYVTDGWTVTHNTTFLNQLIKMIDRDNRVITVEDGGRELTVAQANRVHLLVQRNDGVTKVDWGVVINSLMRLTPDWIIAGELSVGNAGPVFNLMGKGHPIMTTVHSDTPEGALKAFVNNMAMNSGGGGLDAQSTIDTMKGQIGCIIQLDRRDGKRKVVDIHFPMQERASKMVLDRDSELADLKRRMDALRGEPEAGQNRPAGG